MLNKPKPRDKSEIRGKLIELVKLFDGQFTNIDILSILIAAGYQDIEIRKEILYAADRGEITFDTTWHAWIGIKND
jgi:hypothetical protein